MKDVPEEEFILQANHLEVRPFEIGRLIGKRPLLEYKPGYRCEIENG